MKEPVLNIMPRKVDQQSVKRSANHGMSARKTQAGSFNQMRNNRPFAVEEKFGNKVKRNAAHRNYRHFYRIPAVLFNEHEINNEENSGPGYKRRIAKERHKDHESGHGRRVQRIHERKSGFVETDFLAPQNFGRQEQEHHNAGNKNR